MIKNQKEFMKSFKQYREDRHTKNPSEQAYFGTHSVPKGQNPSEQAYFGSHSEKVQSIGEDSESSPKLKYSDVANKRHELSKDDEKHVHENIAPIHSDGLSLDERDAVEEYSDDSASMNKTLHLHHQGHDVSSKNHRVGIAQAGHLDSVLNRHETTDDTHVFTGIRFSPAQHFRKSKEGTPKSVKVDFPAFTSTSTSLKAARDFSQGTQHPNDEEHGVEHGDAGYARHVLKIHVPKGTKAMSLKKMSFVPKENEVLLHRGHTLEIHHQPEHIGNNTYLWNANVIGHKLNDLSKK